MLEKNEDFGLVDSRSVATAQGYPTELSPGPTGSVAQLPDAAASPTECCPDPIGYKEQNSSKGPASDEMAAARKKALTTPTQGLSKDVDKDSEAGLIDTERIVMDEKDLKLNDVVIKCAVINELWT
ncbi:unnamed protein product [Cuscuta epithymum]|uniref:Uncharacterized protein n=1 Tax=Cuscuta epithymum TaxID=186058 RepID=A0AAV0GFW5_9ASTE|nr:unnamed protein product [Cuscuta epithymum]